MDLTSQVTTNVELSFIRHKADNHRINPDVRFVRPYVSDAPTTYLIKTRLLIHNTRMDHTIFGLIKKRDETAGQHKGLDQRESGRASGPACGMKLQGRHRIGNKPQLKLNLNKSRTY
jgi:hypothetical protein